MLYCKSRQNENRYDPLAMLSWNYLSYKQQIATTKDIACMFPNVSYFQVGMKLVTCLPYPAPSLSSLYEMARCCMFSFCHPSWLGGSHSRNIKPNFFKGKLLISGRVERLGAEDTMMPAGITMSRNSAQGQRKHHEASRYPGDPRWRIAAIAWIQVWCFKACIPHLATFESDVRKS